MRTSVLFWSCLFLIAAVGCDDGGGGADAGPGVDAQGADTGGSDDAQVADGGGDDGGGGGGDGGGGDGGGGDGGTPTPVCGDRTITAPETCDDGNTMAGDGCDASCAVEPSPSCGNGTVDRAAGEECDDGNTTAGDGCSALCRVERPATCGNGMLELALGEECDDGNVTGGDGCGPTCQLEPASRTCGDGTVDPGEVCDDSNTTAGDACNPTCTLGNSTSLFAGMPNVTGRTDGVGTAARFSGQGVIAADNTYLWVAEGDATGSVLRRIEISTATVTTVATLPMGAGAGGIATNGTDTVWVAGGATVVSVATAAPFTVTPIHTMASAGGAGGFADGLPGTATFGEVRGLTWWAGSLWIVDTMAAVIRRMNPTTGEVTTVAGMPFATGGADGVGSVARFTSPRYIVSDGSAILYISDTNGNTIRAMNASTYAVTTFAGVSGMVGYVDGIGTAARIHRPRGITADGSSIYFAEFNQHTIRQGVLATGSISTVAGMAMPTGGYMEGVGTAARFDAPWGLVYHNGSRSLFVYDSGNNVIRRIQ